MKILIITYSLIFVFNSFCFGQWKDYTFFTSEGLFDIYFTDQQNGWVNGGWANSKLYKITDFGDTWEQILEEGAIYNVNVTEKNTVFICVPDGLSYSTDGGTSWNFTNFNYDGIYIRSIDFVDQNHGWVCTDYNHMFYTKDGGINWTEAEVIPSSGQWWRDLVSVSFIDTSKGWVLVNNGDVYSTTDGGLSWAKRGIVEAYSIFNNQGIYFADSLNGYVTEFDGVWKTTDGGANWLLLEKSKNKEIFCFYFLNKDIGWIGGQKGIYRTTNGGNDWLFQYYGKTVQAIQFLNEDIGWAVGNDGLFLYTSNGGGDSVSVVGIDYETNHIKSWRLKQNYPNPFNSSTTINYFIKKPGWISLIIYDLSGRKIKTLMNNYQTANIYSITFNSEFLASGIYFYQLQVENEVVDTKKMILSR